MEVWLSGMKPEGLDLRRLEHSKRDVYSSLEKLEILSGSVWIYLSNYRLLESCLHNPLSLITLECLGVSIVWNQDVTIGELHLNLTLWSGLPIEDLNSSFHVHVIVVRFLWERNSCMMCQKSATNFGRLSNFICSFFSDTL